MNVESRYDEVAVKYDEWVGAGSALDDPVFEDLVGDVGGATVCSIACGQGREARYLAGRGATVTGVDISAELLTHARRHEGAEPLGISYLQGDAQTLDVLGNNTFDGAVCYMALMDIPDHDSAVRAAARVIRPGGWFVFVITHPCYKTPATGDLVDHTNKSVRRTVGQYFVEGYWDGPGLHSDTLPVGAYHRMLSTYVNSLAAAGFTIERMEEPPRDQQPVWQEVPQLLYVRCRN
jgi:ubiquinone/menaquinone biosynthesis C-methylase UbiE